jgi:hypothetical protein
VPNASPKYDNNFRRGGRREPRLAGVKAICVLGFDSPSGCRAFILQWRTTRWIGPSPLHLPSGRATRTISILRMPRTYPTYYETMHPAITPAHSMASLTNTNPTKLVTTFTRDRKLLGSTSGSTSGHNKTTLQTTHHRRVSTCTVSPPMVMIRARMLPTTPRRIKMNPLPMDLPGRREPPSLGPNDASTTNQNPNLLTLVYSVPSRPTRPKTQCSRSGQRLL